MTLHVDKHLIVCYCQFFPAQNLSQQIFPRKSVLISVRFFWPRTQLIAKKSYHNSMASAIMSLLHDHHHWNIQGCKAILAEIRRAMQGGSKFRPKFCIQGFECVCLCCFAPFFFAYFSSQKECKREWRYYFQSLALYVTV